MKRFLLATLALSMVLITNAQLRTPAPSPTQVVKQDFALSNIELNYSRPSLKGRKLYVDLAPAGKVWRTGANAATTLTFGGEVTIGGVKVPAGKYGLLSIPDRKSWILIISKQTDVTNPADYKAEMDVVRIPVAVSKTKTSTETFTIQFANLKPNSCEIQLLWDKAMVSLPVTAEIDGKIMADIEKAMKGNNPPYFSAAMYYLDNNKDLNQAAEWFKKAAEAQPNAYWVQHQYANCLAKLGKKDEAIAAATHSRELAEKAPNADYVKLNDDLLKKLKK
jgi:hypothetical protein